MLKPGARHERHRHHNCDEFFIVLKGQGHIYSEHGEEPSVEGDVVYSPRGCWHGFNNTSNEDVVLVWGWMGAGSIEASGYEVIRRATSERNAWEDPRIMTRHAGAARRAARAHRMPARSRSAGRSALARRPRCKCWASPRRSLAT